MARYVDIAEQLARRVSRGDLAPGAALPAVRELARTGTTTTSTVARAYRYLADHGIVSLADRRRARVAVDGASASARLLAAGRVFRLAGSDDPALQVLLRHIGPAVVPAGTRGSFHGLRALLRGDADGAAVHLRHPTGEDNAPYARALLRGREPHLIHLWRREQGFVVPAGNPHGIAAPADLVGRTVARRETGAGTRVLLDQLLLAAGIGPHTVHGPELTSHLEVALAVAAGIADVALGLRVSVDELGLEFVPVTWESFDLVLAREHLDAARPLVEAVTRPELHREVGALGGYDLDGAGAVRDLAG